MMMQLSARLVITMMLSTLLVIKNTRPVLGFAAAVHSSCQITSRTPTRIRRPYDHYLLLGQPCRDHFQAAFQRLGTRHHRHHHPRPMLLGPPSSSSSSSTASPAFIHCHYLSSSSVGGVDGENGDQVAASSSRLDLSIAPPMAFVHQEWTIEQDEVLWENQDRLGIEQLASLLGRGLGGVEARLAKLKDVDNAAYQRLFADKKRTRRRFENDDDDDDDDSNTRKSQKLVPVSEVLRRIQWDYQLDPKDFFVLHYDRVEDKIIESAMDAPNTHISGNAVRFIDALPEHRIVGIKYQERIVWDRQRKMDLFFSNDGIESIIATYDAWKAQQDAAEAATRARQAQVIDKIRRILGLVRFAQLEEELSSSLSTTEAIATVSMKKRSERFVETGLDLFRQVRNDPSSSLDPTLIPMSDYQALDTISELAALESDALARSTALSEINMAMQRILGKLPPSQHQQLDYDDEQQQQKSPVFDKAAKRRPLPEFREKDVTEKFVKGSGAGGQKVNKTSNRVVLVHVPTNIRIECQDTRSLQQNRKIARKRLREKLDEYLNGSQSKASLAAVEAASKKKKALARSRARQRKRKEACASTSTESSTDDSDDDDFVIK